MERKFTEWFLRLALSAGFLSAVADRFGWWPAEWSAWGDWGSFVEYTQLLNPRIPDALISFTAGVATGLEIILAIGLLIPYKTMWTARISGILLLIFGLAMAIHLNIKAPMDYSVFPASAAAFALSFLVRQSKENVRSS